VKRVHLRRIAKRDIREAVRWYRERDPELAERFLDEVYRTLGMLEQFPNIGGPVFGVPDVATRQMPVDNFPYSVVFKRYSDRLSVLAIAHDRKNPGYWNE
jgi:plasmid stabilization system protein ParE